MFPSLTPSPETFAHLQALVSEEEDIQSDILQQRAYFAGEQFVHLTDRLRLVLAGDTSVTTEDFKLIRLNIIRTVINAVTERLIVKGFDSDEPGTVEEHISSTGEIEREVVKPVAHWAWSTWQRNRMDGKQRRVHEASCRDRESFILVDWAPEGYARFTPYLRYVDSSVGGDGDGMKAFYRNEDEDQDLLYVTKRWTEVSWDAAGRRTQRQRLTVYYPHKIEKFAGYPGSWAPTWDVDVVPVPSAGAFVWSVRVDGREAQAAATEEEGWALAKRMVESGRLAWPIPWLHRDGSPLGIPVAHMRSTAGMEAREAIGPQNALNKQIVDLLAASDMTAFRFLIVFGWQPTDDDGNPLEIEPGRILGTRNAQGSAQVIDGADLSNMSDLIDKWITWAAQVTDTPVSRFIMTKAIAGAETQKQQDGPLVNKLRMRQGDFGNGHEDAMRMARRLYNTFGPGGLDESVAIFTQWESAEVRDEDAEITRADIKINKLKIPPDQVWSELGYDAAKIAEWKAALEAKQAEVAQAVQQGQGQNENQNRGN